MLDQGPDRRRGVVLNETKTIILGNLSNLISFYNNSLAAEEIERQKAAEKEEEEFLREQRELEEFLRRNNAKSEESDDSETEGEAAKEVQELKPRSTSQACLYLLFKCPFE